MIVFSTHKMEDVYLWHINDAEKVERMYIVTREYLMYSSLENKEENKVEFRIGKVILYLSIDAL